MSYTEDSSISHLCEDVSAAVYGVDARKVTSISERGGHASLGLATAPPLVSMSHASRAAVETGTSCRPRAPHV